MTKHVLRIIVTIIILSLVGYVVWYVFFKPDNNSKFEASLKQAVEIQVSVDINNNDHSLNAKLSELKARNYFGGGTNKIYFDNENEHQQEVINIREFLFGLSDTSLISLYYGDIAETFTADELLSLKNDYLYLTKLNSYLNNTLNFYYSYAGELPELSSSEVKLIDDLVNKYVNSYNKLNSGVQYILNYQASESTSISSTISLGTVELYRSIIKDFKNYYSSFINLNLGLKNIFDNKLYDEFIYNFKLIEVEANLLSMKNYVDSMNYQDGNFTDINNISAAVKEMNKKLYDASVISLTLNNHGKQFLSDEVVEAVITYNTLFKEYKEIIFDNTEENLQKSIYFRSNEVKHNIITNNEVDEIIKQGYLNSVQEVLVFLGF